MDNMAMFIAILLITFRIGLANLDKNYEEGCSENTVNHYCPSTCAVEKEILSYGRQIRENIMAVREKLQETESLQDTSSQDDEESFASGHLTIREQNELKEAVRMLEESSNTQRKAVADVLTEIEDQKRIILTLLSEIDELADECGNKCDSIEGENKDYEKELPPIRPVNCDDDLCGRAAYGVTVLARYVQNGQVCFEYGAPELRNCADLYERGYKKSGIYSIKPEDTKPSFPVYCDMEDSGGGWIVIQRRVDGSLDFNRTWEEYENGFGNISCNGEFWLGNKYLASIGLTGYQRSKIILTDWSGEYRVAQYSYFKVNQATHWYTLQISAFQEENSNVSDAMTSHFNQNNMRFTTADQDHIYSVLPTQCPRSPGGWWFNKCNSANLNGYYHQGSFSPSSQPGGIVWTTWKGPTYSLKATEMKLRPYGYDGD